MNKVSIHEATKEQLIDIIRQLKKQLKDAKSESEVAVEVKELQNQVAGLQSLLQEKNDEIQALRMQCRMLTEKCASDEATISTLLERVEELQNASTNSSGGAKDSSATGATAATPFLTARPVGPPSSSPPRKQTRPGGGGATVAGGAATPPSHGIGESGGASGGGGEGAKTGATASSLSNQLAAASATLVSKNDEIAKLETQVRELMEVNSFYSAIVSQQHDREAAERESAQAASLVEKAKGRASTGRHGNAERGKGGVVVDTSDLLKRINVLEDQRDKLQRVLRQVEREKHAVATENQELRVELERVNTEMLEVERWQRNCERAARAHLSERPAAATGQGTVSMRASDSGSKNNGVTPERIPATVVSSFSIAPLPGAGGVMAGAASASGGNDRRGLTFSPLSPGTSLGNRRGNNGSRTGHPVGASGRKAMAALSEIRSLKPIHIRNPGPQEKELLHRIDLFERHFSEIEQFEADRQKSFDEMERARAELFVSMNNQLEQQRRVIHQLRKTSEESRNSNKQSCVVAEDGGLPFGAATDAHEAGILPLPPLGCADARTMPSSDHTLANASGDAQKGWEALCNLCLREEERTRAQLQLGELSDSVAMFMAAAASAEQIALNASMAARRDAVPAACEAVAGAPARTAEDAPPVTAASVPVFPLNETDTAKLMDEFREDRLSVVLDTLFRMYGDSLAALTTTRQHDSAGSTSHDGEFEEEEGVDAATVVAALHHQLKARSENTSSHLAISPLEHFQTAAAAAYEAEGPQGVLDSLFAGATGFTGHLPDLTTTITEGSHQEQAATSKPDKPSFDPATYDSRPTAEEEQTSETGDSEGNRSGNAAAAGACEGGEGKMVSVHGPSDDTQAPQELAPASPPGEPSDSTVEDNEVPPPQLQGYEPLGAPVDAGPDGMKLDALPKADWEAQEPPKSDQTVDGDRNACDGDADIHLEHYEDSGEDDDCYDSREAKDSGGGEDSHQVLSAEEEMEMLMQLESALAKDVAGTSTTLGDATEEERDRLDDNADPDTDAAHHPQEVARGEPDHSYTPVEAAIDTHASTKDDKEAPQGACSGSSSSSSSASSRHTELFGSDRELGKPRGPPIAPSFSDDLLEALLAPGEESYINEGRRLMPRINTAPGDGFAPTTPLEDPDENCQLHRCGGPSLAETHLPDTSSTATSSFVVTERWAESIPTPSHIRPAVASAVEDMYAPPSAFPLGASVASVPTIPTPPPSAHAPSKERTMPNGGGDSSSEDDGDFHADFNPFA